MKDNYEILKRNHILKEATKRWIFTFERISVGIGRINSFKDDTQTFFMKFCSKSVEEIENIFFNESKAYTIKAFKNHLNDRIRYEYALKNAPNKYELISDEIVKNSISIDTKLELEESINFYRSQVKNKFKKEVYLLVFDLMVQGASHKEIVEITGLKSAGLIKHRLQKHLRKMRDLKEKINLI